VKRWRPWNEGQARRRGLSVTGRFGGPPRLRESPPGNALEGWLAHDCRGHRHLFGPRSAPASASSLFGDALQIVLIQVKGGSAAEPTSDVRRRRGPSCCCPSTRRFVACCWPTWKKGSAVQFFLLSSKSNEAGRKSTPVSDLDACLDDGVACPGGGSVNFERRIGS
jgi:hypothetical protein